MAEIGVKPFGGRQAKLYTLTNQEGMQVSLTNFGARIVEVLLPLKEGVRNVSLAAACVQEYLDKDFYVGATVAPVAGRISGAKTFIENREIHFTENEPGRTLHSGIDTSVVQYWDAQVEESQNRVIFQLHIPDGHNGFPGAVEVMASYELTDDNELKVRYQAVSEQTTIFNPTNHVYFNLTGDFSRSVGEHEIRIAADYYLPLGEDNLPTGEVARVERTPFDFRNGAPLSQGLTANHPQTLLVGGFDHPWVIQDVETPVEVTSPDGAVRLMMRSNQPSVVIYTYNHGPEGLAAKHGAFSLECQAFPNACNQEGFGSILLEKGQFFESQFSYQFLF